MIEVSIMKALRDTFLRFAERECRGISPLYDTLASQIAYDEDLLMLSQEAAGRGQPIPNMLLGAVHYLLLKGKDHPLSEYYVSIHSPAKDPVDVFKHFKDFCMSFREEIVFLLKTKRVQTNEVRRCGYLYPVFSYVYDLYQKPLAMVEIGTSAGLQLLWDHYEYDYGDGGLYGCQGSNVKIHTTCRSGDPFLAQTVPPVMKRIGIDLKVVDLSDLESYDWLQALIWPEHEERRALFQQAAQVVQDSSLDLREGDGIGMLPEITEELPEEVLMCVFHTHVANQFSTEMKHQLENILKQISLKRDIVHIYNNMWDFNLHLDYAIDGHWSYGTVGQTDGHGSWFTWELT